LKICIDPGHSGPFEVGAYAAGVTEAEVNLQVSKILAKMLESAGHQVILTREGDVGDDLLTWRVEMAEDFGADIFISIHCNSVIDPESHGTEVFHFPGSESGQALAACIQAGLIAVCHTTDRGIKTNEKWNVLKDTTCPAVLVELAFLSNDKEREMLTDRFVQRMFAVGIVQGVAKYAEGGPLFSGQT